MTVLFILLKVVTNFSFAQVTPPYSATVISEKKAPLRPRLAEQCGLLVESEGVVSKNNRQYLQYDRIATKASNGYPLCETTFLKEGSIVVKPGVDRCSGCLLAPDLFLTAGHCLTGTSSIEDAREGCKNRKLVLNFSQTEVKPDPGNPGLLGLKPDQVYACSEVLSFSHNPVAARGANIDIPQNRDFALIRLDRKTPFDGIGIRRSGTARDKSVLSYSHPWGLQMIEASGKILDRSRRSKGQNFSFHLGYIEQGSSGSLLLGQQSGVVECIVTTGHLTSQATSNFEIDKENSCLKYRTINRFEFPVWKSETVKCLPLGCIEGAMRKPENYVFNPQDFMQPDSPRGYCQGENFCVRQGGKLTALKPNQKEGLAAETRVRGTMDESLSASCTPLEDIHRILDPHINASKRVFPFDKRQVN